MKFEIDTSDLLRINANERFDAYQKGLSSGILTIDEVRRMENLPVLDLPFVKMSLADVLFNTKSGEIFVPNTNSTMKSDGVINE